MNLSEVIEYYIADYDEGMAFIGIIVIFTSIALILFYLRREQLANTFQYVMAKIIGGVSATIVILCFMIA